MAEEEQEQTAEVIEFCCSHRKELKPAEQWLNTFDGNIVSAWLITEKSQDWKKLLFLEWLFRDKKLYEHKLEVDGFDVRQWCETDEQVLADFYRRRTHGTWHTEHHPIYYIVQAALEEGKKAVTDVSPQKPPLGPIASLIYEKLKSLPEHKAMTGPEIADWLNNEHEINLDESTIRTNHLEQLKPYGLYNKKRIGYCIRD